MVLKLEPLMEEIPNKILKDGNKIESPSDLNNNYGCVITCDQPCYDSPAPCFVMNGS